MRAVYELRQKYNITSLLKCAGVPRSTYYYHVDRFGRKDKYGEIKKLIQEIFQENHGRYGYRRITLALHNRGCQINHKTVRRILKELGLVCRVRMRKYNSYRGQIGKAAPNILNRNFGAEYPNQKWVTDVTEFRMDGEKLYLSPIIDLFNGEVISYDLSYHPDFKQIKNMLAKAFERVPECQGLIFHSDQGWQYRMEEYRRILKDNDIIQSMSCKATCLDNAVAENFFSLLKTELLYLQDFHSIEHLRREIEAYIEYYNNQRIKLRLRGMSPVQYRLQLESA